MQPLEDTVERGGCDHKTRVYSTTNDPAERVPGPIVEPVVETVEPVFSQVLGRPVVEVGIELVDDTLESENRKQPGGEREHGRHGQDQHLQESVLFFRRHPHEPCWFLVERAGRHFDRSKKFETKL